MKKIQVILINGKNIDTAGGYQTYTSNLEKVLKSLGVKVRIFSFDKSGIKNTSLSRLIFLGPILAWNMLRQIKFEEPTIIWGIGPWSLAGALVKIFSPKVIFFSYYPTSFKHEFRANLEAVNIKDYGFILKLQAWLGYLTIIPLYTLLEKFFLNCTDKIIIHYDSARKILKEEFNINPKKIIKTADYVGSNKIISKGKNNDFILVITRHDGRKGINFLMHAFKLLKDRGVKYKAVIIGNGRLFYANKKLANSLGLSSVRFFGFVSDPSYYLKHSKLYVFPSLEEGSSSISILEAMGSGIPIVSTNVDGIKEDLENGKSALLVDSKSPKALADGMEKLLSDGELASRLGKNAKLSFQKKHNMEKVKRQLDFLITSYNT